MKTYAADRLNNLQESVIRSITRYAFDKGAILLAQGFPDFDPPQEVLAAAEKAMPSVVDAPIGTNWSSRATPVRRSGQGAATWRAGCFPAWSSSPQSWP